MLTALLPPLACSCSCLRHRAGAASLSEDGQRTAVDTSRLVATAIRTVDGAVALESVTVEFYPTSGDSVPDPPQIRNPTTSFVLSQDAPAQLSEIIGRLPSGALKSVSVSRLASIQTARDSVQLVDSKGVSIDSTGHRQTEDITYAPDARRSGFVLVLKHLVWLTLLLLLLITALKLRVIFHNK